MTTALHAFPADGFTARWQRWEHDADETLTLRWENEGWTALGEVGRERVTYVVRLSPTWQVRQFLLFRDLEDPDLWLGTDGSGRWGEMNGAHRTDLDGCVDLTLACTPFTDTIPIRRLQLDVGDAAEVTAVGIDVETLGLVPVRRRYEHLDERRWRRITLGQRTAGRDADPSTADASTDREFEVDRYGLVHDVEQQFRRR